MRRGSALAASGAAMTGWIRSRRCSAPGEDQAAPEACRETVPMASRPLEEPLGMVPMEVCGNRTKASAFRERTRPELRLGGDVAIDGRGRGKSTVARGVARRGFYLPRLPDVRRRRSGRCVRDRARRPASARPAGGRGEIERTSATTTTSRYCSRQDVSEEIRPPLVNGASRSGRPKQVARPLRTSSVGGSLGGYVVEVVTSALSRHGAP